MALHSDLYHAGDLRAERNRLTLGRGAAPWPLRSRRGLTAMLAIGLAITASYAAQGFLAAAARGARGV